MPVGCNNKMKGRRLEGSAVFLPPPLAQYPIDAVILNLIDAVILNPIDAVIAEPH